MGVRKERIKKPVRKLLGECDSPRDMGYNFYMLLLKLIHIISSCCLFAVVRFL